MNLLFIYNIKYIIFIFYFFVIACATYCSVCSGPGLSNCSTCKGNRVVSNNCNCPTGTQSDSALDTCPSNIQIILINLIK
jgi:hypothetical protein